VIHIQRQRFLSGSRFYEHMTLTNYSEYETHVPLTLAYAADFADIFEVQGQVRPEYGQALPPVVSAHAVQLAYRGLDEVLRTTAITFSAPPQAISSRAAEFLFELPHGASADFFIEIGVPAAGLPSRERFEAAAEQLAAQMRARLQQGASLVTSGRLFSQWIEKSRADLALLTTVLPTGPYPYAGIPWFATQFGRDAIITALQTLWLNPCLAAGVLRFLASTQAQDDSSFRDAQPGKIMHETRRGEMAALREVPFGQYYGGVDTTPLFVMLAGAYEKRTGDGALVDRLWPALLAATAWIERRLESSPTGFLDYARGEQTGLVNQSWKDSHDSVFHADGRFPQGPVAVVEVQGYAYAALRTMAELTAARGDHAPAEGWQRRAERLRGAIEDKFWVPAMGFYAMALDGDGEPCQVYGSDAGHLLYCGVPSAERARLVTEQLLSSRFSSGWGIRTLAEGEARYNPMSYHNGSIWPHDTALCAAGMARYGGREHVVHILGDIFEAANHFAMRLPELYCGFPRIPGQAPIPYPVACLPQAWSAGTVFMLLQASLGIRVDGQRNEIHVEHPLLPLGLEHVSLRALPINDAHIDLDFRRIGDQVVVVPARHHDCGVQVLAHL
ncbi:MAG TPA: amylo-alpha-1,6-glucosidase, partial [Thermoanaerobaculia bacterium]|nr:amylo-alpha-1,6-glucosidase [Thermoanaerobaculia bacterium]